MGKRERKGRRKRADGLCLTSGMSGLEQEADEEPSSSTTSSSSGRRRTRSGSEKSTSSRPRRQGTRRRASVEAYSAMVAMNLQMKRPVGVQGRQRSTKPTAAGTSSTTSRPSAPVGVQGQPTGRRRSAKAAVVRKRSSTTTSGASAAPVGCTCRSPPTCPVHSHPQYAYHHQQQPSIFPFPTTTAASVAGHTTLPAAAWPVWTLPTTASAAIVSSDGVTSYPAVLQGHLIIGPAPMFAPAPPGGSPVLDAAGWTSGGGQQGQDDEVVPDEPHSTSPSTSAWKPVGRPARKWVYLNNDCKPVRRDCFDAIRHSTEGDLIRARDCVVVNSGRTTSQPYVAKVAQFFLAPDGSVWASIGWYYWPGQAPVDSGQERALLTRAHPRELLASRHVDCISVDSIEDLAFVVTLSEYNRYVAENKAECQPWSPEDPVARAWDQYPRRTLMPAEDTDDGLVFFVRRVYDFHGKRILNNPSF